jgi:hypothetical protein
MWSKRVVDHVFDHVVKPVGHADGFGRAKPSSSVLCDGSINVKCID